MREQPVFRFPKWKTERAVECAVLTEGPTSVSFKLFRPISRTVWTNE